MMVGAFVEPTTIHTVLSYFRCLFARVCVSPGGASRADRTLDVESIAKSSPAVEEKKGAVVKYCSMSVFVGEGI